jgi:hypothetical protein
LTPIFVSIEEKWNREIEIRVAVYDAGNTKTYPTEDVFAEARHLVLKKI